MSKRAYHLQRGRQMQQLNDETLNSTKDEPVHLSAKSAKEVAKYRELCPPGTDNATISQLLSKARGDAQAIENAINELWEDARTHPQHDEWATVSKKNKKKQEPPSSGRSQRPPRDQTEDDRTRGGRTSSSRGRSNPAASTRGGRGRGRGRSTRENTTDAGENTSGEEVAAHDRKTNKRPATKSTPKSAPKPKEQTQKPPVVTPVLTGAWTKRPNLTGAVETPPVEPVLEAPKSPEKSEEPQEQQAAEQTQESEKVDEVNEPQAQAEEEEEEEQEKEESTVASGWSVLDASPSLQGGWPSADATPKEMPASPSNNAWATSPILNSQPTTTNAATSPTPLEAESSVPPQEQSTSPKQYLKMGKWDSVDSTNLSLQFGSFSLNNDDAKSPKAANWSAETPAENAWNQPLETNEATPAATMDNSVRPSSASSAASAPPPGLSVETEPTAKSPPPYHAPSAPSPHTLPKPESMKAPENRSNIGGSNYASEFAKPGLYQPSYGQYPPMNFMNSTSPIPNAKASPQPAFQIQQDSNTPNKQNTQAPTQSQTPNQMPMPHPHGYPPQYAPPPPPGMAMAYNPYNYPGYFQGYGYYQNPQYAQYSPRTQYPPRGNVPYGVPANFDPNNMPYQEQMMAQQHEYPQGFGEINMPQQGGQQPPNANAGGKSSSASRPSGNAPQSYGGHHNRSNDNPNYGHQQYGWQSYGGQPVAGGWNQMMPQGYPQNNPHASGNHPQNMYQHRQYDRSASSGNASGEATGNTWSS